MKKSVLYVTLNAVLLAGGILMIIIPSVIFDNYWSLLSILVFCVAFVFPLMCRAFRIGDQVTSWESSNEMGGMLAWLLFGTFVTIGYSVPFELWRSSAMNAIGMGLTMGGGTIILVAILVFTQFQWKT